MNTYIAKFKYLPYSRHAFSKLTTGSVHEVGFHAK